MEQECELKAPGVGSISLHSMGHSLGSTHIRGSYSAPLSLVPEKATLGHQVRGTVPAQYWGMSMASASSPDGAVASSVSDPVPLPLLAGSGLSRPHLLLATQVLKVPGHPSAPGLPSVCQSEGGLVLDRVLAHGTGDSWWAVLSGRSRLGRITAQRADLLAAACDPSNYSLCANSRVQLSRHTVLRSRLGWCPPISPAPTGTAAIRGGAAEATCGSSQGRGWASPSALSLSCQLRSRVGPRTEARADLAIGQRAASCSPWSPGSAPMSGVGVGAADASHAGGCGREGQSTEADAGACGWAGRTPLLLGLQAGSVGSAGSPLVWRCGVLQVIAPPTVRLAGSCSSDGTSAAGRSLQSAVYVQGTVGFQGERFLWRAPKKPQRRRSRSDAAAMSTTGVATAGGFAAFDEGPSFVQPPPPPPTLGLGPHNPVRQAAGYVLNRIGAPRGGGGAAADDDDDSAVTTVGGGGSGAPGRAAAGVSAGGGGMELPSAGQVQKELMDATQSISRLRDDVTQATQWVAGGGLVKKLSAAVGGGDTAVAARRQQQQRQRSDEDRDRSPATWSAFVGPPHVKVAGVAGLTVRAPVIMLTHGTSGAAVSDANAGSTKARNLRGRGDTDLLGPAVPSGGLLPVRLAWMQDLGLTQLVHRFRGRGDGGEGEGENPVPSGANAAAATAGDIGGGVLVPVSRGSLRPFASAAASVQAGRFSGWLLDFTRLSCQLDCGLWGPAIQGAGSSSDSGIAARQRHPAFALGDTGAWHSLSASLSQQLVGPLRFAANLRYELVSSRPLTLPPPPQAAPAAEPPPLLRSASGKAALAAAAAASAAASWLPGAAAGVAGHLGGMRPQLMDAVYALDLAVPGAQGAVRLVAWYAPHRREGMVELRMF